MFKFKMKLEQINTELLESSGLNKETEINLAKDMVRDFHQIERPWSKFKKAVNQNQSEFETMLRYTQPTKELFDILKKYRVILDYQVGIFFKKSDKWEELDFKKIRFLNPSATVKFVYTFEPKFKNFITGNWFNAYVYQALADQFNRLDVDYEIYPLVSYNSTANAKLSNGEIDALARIDKKILFVECKSGWLLNDRTNQIREIKESREKVKEICHATRFADYNFMLVYNSLSNPPEEINKAFAGTDIFTIEITDLRGKIIDFVGKLKF